jgi:hypothetical protein
MSKLSKETRERIKADAISWSENQYGHDDVNKDYLEGALHEAGRAKELADALEKVLSVTSWMEENAYKHQIRKVVNTALAKYKEVSNG